MQTINLRHLSWALVLLVVPALLAAGCGGGPSANNKPSNKTADDQALKYTQCLQQHGINASTSGGGSGVTVQGNLDGTGQQQIQAAQNACKQYQPTGGKSSGQPSAQELDQMAKFAQCMNQHGVPVQQQGGTAMLPQAVPGTDKSKVRQAQQACQQYMHGG